MSTTTPAPAVAADVESPAAAGQTFADAIGLVAPQVEAAVASPEGRKIIAAAKKKLPSGVRRTIYKVAQYLGVVVAVGAGVEAAIKGQPGDLAGTAAGVFVTLQSLVSELHITD